MSVIRLENVSYTYRGASAPAVNRANCEFEAGRLYAVIGRLRRKETAGKMTSSPQLAHLRRQGPWTPRYRSSALWLQ